MPPALETVQDFLNKLDMKQQKYASSGNHHFFIKSCNCHTYQNYEQPPQRSQNSDFQSCFSEKWLNLSIFKNILVGDQLLLLIIFFENFDF